MVSLLDDVIRNRTPEEKQAAITTLGNLPIANTEKVFTRLLDELQSGKLPKEVQFELSDALDSSGSQGLQERFQKLTAGSSPDSLKAAYAGAILGGDPRKGGAIFWNNSSAQCVRCHAIDDYGGNVGPRLNGVANRLSREQLLEALIEPSARIAPGFGLVTLELKNGQKINGILQQEKPEGYLMKVGDKPDTMVRKAEVVNRINSPSSMPPMHLLLKKKEIRDVVSYLATLKEN
jgi:putative heme-binding domain-containing protein